MRWTIRRRSDQEDLRATLSEAMALAAAEDLSRAEPREVLEIVAGDEVRHLLQAGARYEPGAI